MRRNAYLAVVVLLAMVVMALLAAPGRATWQYDVEESHPLSRDKECSILLVDDDCYDYDNDGEPDENDTGRPYYTSTLETLGYTYNVWDTENMGTPSAGDMAAYDAVIWFTGYDPWTPISPTEEVELMAYLEDGGNLFMSSQEQEWAYPGSTIMSGYFWVDSVNEDVILTGTVGGPADPLFSGLGPYDMDRPDQWHVYWPTGGNQGPYDDEVYVKPGGFEPMIYVDSGEPNSTRYMSDTFKTIYLGFPFEWLPDLGDRTEFMGTALEDWFGCAAPCIELTGLPISGPDVVLPGEAGTYSVTVEPPNASEPIDVVWSNGMTGTSAIYSWADPGSYTIVVTGTNCEGAAVVTEPFAVDVPCVELSSATIEGPDTLAPGETSTYSVTLAPPSATEPIDVLWSNGETGYTTAYSWTVPGDYTIFVTGTNCAGTGVVTGTLPVAVAEPMFYVYLPVVVKNR
jgi:hypothetical protein